MTMLGLQHLKHVWKRLPRELVDCGMIAVGFSIPILILRPFQNVPFVDDWVYAWSVEWLLKTGHLKILEFSTSVNPLQVVWGWLFCLPSGFSFTALRVSTWVAALLCLWGLYLTLREFNVSRRDTLIGTSLLAAYPIFLVLTFTFMTDVPFLSAAVWACLAFARAVRRESNAWLMIAAILACGACAVRLTGIGLPGMMIAVLLFGCGEWGRRKSHLVIAIIPVIFLVALFFWYHSHIQHTADLRWVGASPANRLVKYKQSAMRILPEMLIRNLPFAAGAIGMALLPLTVACLRREHLRRALALSALLGGAVMTGRAMGSTYTPPLDVGSMWTVLTLGSAKSLVDGYAAHRLDLGGDWLYVALTLLLGGCALSFLLRRSVQPGESSLIWWWAGQFFLAALVWLLYDRYALVYIPAAIVLALLGQAIVRPAAAIALICLFAVHALVGTHDNLEYSRVLWSAVDYLRQNRVPDSEIGGGYVINGWLQYAHPENARRDEEGRIQVIGFTVKGTLKYKVANAPMPGFRIIKEFPYRQWLAESGSIYALQRSGSATGEH